MRAFILAIILFFFSAAISIAEGKTDNKIVINIPSRTLTLFVDGKIYKTFPVGVGRAGFPTPIGNFSVIRKVINPGWENPYKPHGLSRIAAGNTNPLGTRWIGFKADDAGEFGIHGTDNPPSVGKFSSHGCVRMYVKDAEEVFKNIEVGSPVQVTYNTIKIDIDDSKVYMVTYPDTYKLGQMTISKFKEYITSLDQKILWNASLAFEAFKTLSDKPVKIGTIVDEKDFY